MTAVDLSGKRALVTGGARGLGAGMAQALADAGAAVMIGDILDDLGRETAEKIGATGATAGFVHLDVTQDADWESAVGGTVAELGGFDILVNNAGIEISALVIDADADDLRKMLDVNVVGEPRHEARLPGDASGRRRGHRRRDRQRGVGGRDDPVPRHLGLLGDEVGGRPAHPRRRRSSPASSATGSG